MKLIRRPQEIMLERTRSEARGHRENTGWGYLFFAGWRQGRSASDVGETTETARMMRRWWYLEGSLGCIGMVKLGAADPQYAPLDEPEYPEY